MKFARRASTVAALLIVATMPIIGAAAVERPPVRRPPDRVEMIRRRGFVTCGVASGIAGFAQIDADGRYSGLDVEVCRALAAAILGSADRIRYSSARTVQDFLRHDEVDVISRRLTWELRREATYQVLFGPVTFFDGQGFLVSKHAATSGAGALATTLAAAAICVEQDSRAEDNLIAWFGAAKMHLHEVRISTADAGASYLADARCTALTADVSELGSVRSHMPDRDAYEILRDQISKEPLAPLVRQGDDRFFNVLRWTIFALIEAEELGVDSTNVRDMLKNPDPAVRRLLGVVPGNGAALGLGERWAYLVIRDVGNYGEIFDRTVGRSSVIGLDRGLNNLWTAGGLLYAPPLR